MTDISRLGLGCMGMSIARNPEASIKTIRTALDEGITLFNTGEFYNAGESEMVVGQALKGVPRDNYFMSVKFGVLPLPGGGIYGLDVKPFNVKGHLTYSLRRLGLDYVDLYQPARQDTTVPVEELVGAIAEQVKAGYVKHIGLSEVDAETLRRAHKVHPIHTVEIEYSLLERKIETELVETARELGVKVLAYGTIGHGLFADKVLAADFRDPYLERNYLSPANKETNMAMLKELKKIADSKGCTMAQLSLAWSLAKYPHVQSLVGTTNPDNLKSNVAALKIDLTPDDISAIEAAVDHTKVLGKGMRNFVFTDGVMSVK